MEGKHVIEVQNEISNMVSKWLDTKIEGVDDDEAEEEFTKKYFGTLEEDAKYKTGLAAEYLAKKRRKEQENKGYNTLSVNSKELKDKIIRKPRYSKKENRKTAIDYGDDDDEEEIIKRTLSDDEDFTKSKIASKSKMRSKLDKYNKLRNEILQISAKITKKRKKRKNKKKLV